MILKLEDPAAIPDHLMRELDACRAIFENNEYLDQRYKDDPTLAWIHGQLREHLATQRIRAYHCTREPEPGYFQANGLRVTDLAAHRREFVDRFGHLFTAAERARLYRLLDTPIETAELGRNGKVWACLSRSIVIDSGTDDLFGYFGGEALRKWWDAAPIILPKLATIGEPVVVEAVFAASELNSYCNIALTVLSQYHRTIRPDAYYHASEAHLARSVPAQDVIAVTPKNEFEP